ncbi:SLC13 family permease [Nonomuraea sp. NPDC050643]|uniref:SLC13 family permease n=1 Tax=Nonomuraea sp. NPDC050643 TaxID=3155660 RepID=UPI00340460E5
MSLQIVSVIVLLAVFVVGTTRPVNLGALALVATFGVGMLLAGEDFDTAVSGFPIDVFLLLFGVTYLFGIASVNGTVEWLVGSAARLVRENRTAIPWVLFALAAIPTTAGAAGPAGVALLAPIALRMAEKHRINARLAGLMVIHGSNSGNFSPLNVLGVIVNGTVDRDNLDVDPVWPWVGNFAFSVVLGVATFLLFGGRELMKERRSAAPALAARSTPGSPEPVPGSASEPAAAGEPAPPPRPAGGGVPGHDDAPSPVVLTATLLAIVGVGVGALGFDLEIGVLAITAAVVLHLLFPASSKGALTRVSWSTVLLICGVVTYVALMQRMGTVKMIGESVAGIDSPLLAALLLCFIAGLTSAFASSIGVLGAMIPLAVPFLLSGDIGVTGVVIALAISATAVDATPFSSIGALTVASAPEREREGLYRGLIRWGFSMVLVAPLTTWLIFVVIA